MSANNWPELTAYDVTCTRTKQDATAPALIAVRARRTEPMRITAFVVWKPNGSEDPRRNLLVMMNLSLAPCGPASGAQAARYLQNM
jgi:hypothetical protein